MKRGLFLKFSVVDGHGQLLHVRITWKRTPCFQYYVPFTASDISLNDAIGITWSVSQSIYPSATCFINDDDVIAPSNIV